MTVREQNNQIQFEFDLKLRSMYRWAGKKSWENHIERDRPASTHGSICDLDVLDLGRLSGDAISGRRAFDPDELQLYRLDRRRAVLDDQLASQRRSDVARRRIKLPDELERWNLVQRALLHVLKRFRDNPKLRGLQRQFPACLRDLYDELQLPLYVAREDTPFDFGSDAVLNADKDAVIRFIELLIIERRHNKIEGQLQRVVAQFSWSCQFLIPGQKDDRLARRVEGFKKTRTFNRGLNTYCPFRLN
mmetsp:Transcript_49863/g.108015  ORF Transcript_49863/g.108015 Transcript_49863/m.108015 type:complete len:247 (-) Transcript_49863:54-794(-)